MTCKADELQALLQKHHNNQADKLEVASVFQILCHCQDMLHPEKFAILLVLSRLLCQLDSTNGM